MPTRQGLKTRRRQPRFRSHCRTGNNRHGPVLSMRCRSRPPACAEENVMPETVVITGASAGVGRAVAQLWATEHRGALMAGTLAIVAFVTTLIVGSKPLARVYQTSSEPDRLDDPGDNRSPLPFAARRSRFGVRIIGLPAQPSTRGLCSSHRMKSRFAGLISSGRSRAVSATLAARSPRLPRGSRSV